MSDILKLKEAIEKALTVNDGFTVDHSVLDAENSALMQMLGSAGSNRPPKDRMREAILQFRATNQLQNLAAARFVCFGAAERFGNHEPPLLEERDRFPRLLGLIDEYRPEPRGFRRCFRGLLHTYIVYDGEHRDTCGEGRDNWYALRDYLHDRRNDIVVQGTQPDWVACIAQHSNLLTADPASRYASDLLLGRRDAVEEIRSQLDVSDHHWLMRKLILAQIELSTRDADAQFSRKVESLLGLLDGHEGLEDEGLGLILNRYATIVNPSLHAGLRDRSVRTWGNPWITNNRKKWARVSNAASALVTNWFKLHVIRTFFELMSDDRQIDQRRVKFWEQYHERIDDMYFALGSTTRYSSNSAVKEMRRQMGDRLLGLRSAGASSNNAFIMMMGDVVAVEFGVTGHACFFYKRDSVPFSLRGEVSGSTADDGLRSSNNLERLTHVDARSGRWEENFAYALQRHGAGRLLPTADRAARAAPLPPRGAPLNSASLRDFCQSNGIAWVDNTERGGNIAVRFAYNTGIIADQLKAWRFTFSDQREIWWRKSWPS
jgi:hypothetical protein